MGRPFGVLAIPKECKQGNFFLPELLVYFFKIPRWLFKTELLSNYSRTVDIRSSYETRLLNSFFSRILAGFVEPSFEQSKCEVDSGCECNENSTNYELDTKEVPRYVGKEISGN